MAPTQAIIFGPEADGFADALGRLCHQTLAVTITLHSGERFGAAEGVEKKLKCFLDSSFDVMKERSAAPA